MNILITGGAGFIGSHLATKYLQKDNSVTIVDNLLTGNIKNIKPLLELKKLTFYQEDILDFDFQKLKKFDLVYHLASPASPVKYKKFPIETLMVNTYGTKRVLDFILKSQSKTFVFSSTSEVYGDPLIHPQTESYFGNVNPVGDRSCYDESKRLAESLIINYYHKYNLDVRIARIFNTYGPNMEYDDGRAVSNLVTQALKNSPLTIYGDGSQTRSFCYVSDMVEALFLLGTTQNLKGEIINLGNPEEITILELAKLIIKLTSTKAKIVYQQNYSDDPKKRKPDISKAKKMLNWQPKVTLEVGLGNTIEYFNHI